MGGLNQSLGAILLGLAGSASSRPQDLLEQSSESLQSESVKISHDDLWSKEQLLSLGTKDSQGNPILPDSYVATLETRIAERFSIPDSWKVELRSPDFRSEAKPYYARISTLKTGDERMEASLRGPEGLELRFNLTADGCWALISNALFIAEDGKSEFSRDQFKTRTNFFPIRSIPGVLSSLTEQLTALPDDGFAKQYLQLENAEPLAIPPTASCSISLSRPEANYSAILRGKITFPVECGQPVGFRYEGNQRLGDSVIGPDTTSLSLSEVMKNSAEIGRACLSSKGLSFTLRHGLNDILSVYFKQTDGTPLGSVSFPFNAVTNNGSFEPEFVLAKQEQKFRIDTIMKLVSLIEEETSNKDRALYGVISGPDGQSVIVMTSPKVEIPTGLGRSGMGQKPEEITLKVVKLRDGAPIEIVSSESSRVEEHQRGDSRTEVSLATAALGQIKLYVHNSVFCADGMDLSELETYALIDEKRLAFLGGIAESIHCH